MTIFRSDPVRHFGRRLIVRAFSIAALSMLLLAPIGKVGAQVPPAPGGSTVVLGSEGVYECIGQPPKRIEFKVVSYERGLFRFEERVDGRNRLTLRYPWQLVGTTVVRQQTRPDGAWKYRKISGSLQRVSGLRHREKVSAYYFEKSVDAGGRDVEWGFELQVGAKVAVQEPTATEAVTIRERRWHQVDSSGFPAPLSESFGVFTREFETEILYSPALGVPVRRTVYRDGKRERVCRLTSYKLAGTN